MKRKASKNQLADFWIENYCSEHCTLCGNSGVIDTRKTAITATGMHVGRLNWCICPNGRVLASVPFLEKEEVLKRENKS